MFLKTSQLYYRNKVKCHGFIFMLWPLAWFFHFVIFTFRFGLTTQRFIWCTFLYENCISWIYVLNSTSFAFALFFFCVCSFFFHVLLLFCTIFSLLRSIKKNIGIFYVSYSLLRLFFVRFVSNWFFVVVVSFGEKRKMFNYFYSEHSTRTWSPIEKFNYIQFLCFALFFVPFNKVLSIE